MRPKLVVGFAAETDSVENNAKNKLDRKFDHLINILGADHDGYIKRISSNMEGIKFNF